MALPQPLHIFRKDLLHLWPETLFVLLLFVAFCFAAPSGWSGSEYATYAIILSWLLKVLMPISWLVLIARAIQDESLVGDRQFWTSRPYHWAKLLAAKALFIFVWIYIPFFAMQVYLLRHAGLHPMLALPALLHNLLLLTVVVIIPLAALAAVTSTFPRLLLSFIGTVIYIVILLGVVGWVTFNRMQVPHLDWIIDGIFIALPAVALFIQYRTRKTLISRTLLVITPILAALVALLVPTNALVAHAYPVASGKSAPVLSPLTDRFPAPAVAGHLMVLRNNVAISLPVGVTGVQKDVNLLVQGTRTTVSAPGTSYTSPFVSSFGPPAQFNDGRPFALLTFTLPLDVFNKIHLVPTDLHLQLASETLKAEPPSTWKATLLPFSVPGNGICTFPADDSSGAPPTCRYPVRQPEVSFVSAQLAAASCSHPAAPPVTGQTNIGGGASSLDFDPVITVPLKFQTGDPDPSHNYVLCPGTALSFVEGNRLSNTSLVLDQKQLVLDPYATRAPDRAEQPGQPEPGQLPAQQSTQQPGQPEAQP
jgi:hypothetical protein